MAEKITVECPACKSLVRVPKSDATLRVKCPACTLPFVVSPQKRAPGDDTVAGWVLDGVDEAEDERMAVPPPPPPPPTAPRSERRLVELSRQSPKAPTPSPPPPPASPGDTALLPLEESPQPPSQQAPAAHAPVASALDEASRKREEAKAKLRAMLERRKPAEPEPAAPAPAAPSSSSHMHGATIDRSKWTADTFPQDINIAWALPHLVVKECTPAGVRFLFDSVWLEHLGFRTSMPLRCFASGHDVPDELYARPMVFCDQSGGMVRSPQYATAGVGQRMSRDRSPREVETLLSKVEHMAVPFDHPVPYYATMACGDIYMECTTHKRPDGGWTADVLIPDLITALQWLANVNGITGPEYFLLDREVAAARSEAWTSLALPVRMRLASWINFKPGESFVRYFNDAAAMAKDSGLGGVVITGDRLIHRHRSTTGEVDIEDASATLIIRVEEDTPVLFLRKGTESSRITRLRVEDVNDFVDIITARTKIQLELADM
jgi:hypothetical protein